MLRNTLGSLAVVVLIGTAACTSPPGAPPPAPAGTPGSPAPTELRPPPPPQLPGGGRVVLPGHRLVGFSGAPGARALGPLTGDLDRVAQRLREKAAPYAADEPVLPVFELIATRANAAPGPDGMYRSRSGDRVIEEYLAAARRAGAVLLLGIQPGRADFLDEVRHYERWLREPDVGLALDPEWAVGPGQVPGETFGSTTGAELDRVAAYLAGLVRDYDLPQKVMVYHQLSPQVVHEEQQLAPRPEVALVKSVDGIGSPAAKTATWRQLIATKPPYVAAGFKLFYEEDTRHGPLMTPAEVLALRPAPQYVLYE